MSEDSDAADAAWFSHFEPGNDGASGRAINEGSAERADRWPRLAVESGFAASIDDYYQSLRNAAIQATEQQVREREGADDQLLKHGIRALDDLDRVANELAERTAEWRGSLGEVDGAPDDEQTGRAVDRIDDIIDDINETSEELQDDIERTMHDIAPNLTALAGPLLGARLIATAGSLERLAKMPSGTVQVLGAEDALFAHLSSGAPPPKHGLIYTHEFVRGTRPTDRGSASRAVAGKLAIAARIDHYAGDHRPALEAELRERIDRIRGQSS